MGVSWIQNVSGHRKPQARKALQSSQCTLQNWGLIFSELKAKKNHNIGDTIEKDRRPMGPMGWFHDGIIKININGNNLQVDFLEVVEHILMMRFFVYDTPAQLYLLEDIIKDLLSFRKCPHGSNPYEYRCTNKEKTAVKAKSGMLPEELNDVKLGIIRYAVKIIECVYWWVNVKFI
ncbi:hypothetical protein C1646_743615 [Rhizophagus diaphanus]|nr:hypothetical protein C1646_743615 [Rhizophagus diaphanus] [Rhizophagus sp. MUCL 43196]